MVNSTMTPANLAVIFGLGTAAVCDVFMRGNIARRAPAGQRIATDGGLARTDGDNTAGYGTSSRFAAQSTTILK
jgi:hypothetical protein